MPYTFVKLAYGEEPPKFEKKINPAKNNMIWIRGMDFEPVLVSREQVESEVAKLEKLIKDL
jgi:hypothetical protein